MKRTVKILALVLVFVMAVTVLASCGKRLSGTYVSAESNSFAFSGTSFTYTQGTIEFRGTYEIKKVGEDYRIVLLKEKQVSNGVVTTLTEPSYIGGEEGVEFYSGDGYIIISATKYEKTN